MIPIVTGTHIAIAKKHVVTPWIIREIFTKPTSTTHYIRAHGHSVAWPQDSSAKFQITSALLVNLLNYQYIFMSLNDGIRNVDLIGCSLVLHTFAAIGVLIGTADARGYNTSDCGPLAQFRHFKCAYLYFSGGCQHCRIYCILHIDSPTILRGLSLFIQQILSIDRIKNQATRLFDALVDQLAIGGVFIAAVARLGSVHSLKQVYLFQHLHAFFCQEDRW